MAIDLAHTPSCPYPSLLDSSAGAHSPRPSHCPVSWDGGKDRGSVSHGTTMLAHSSRSLAWVETSHPDVLSAAEPYVINNSCT